MHGTSLLTRLRDFLIFRSPDGGCDVARPILLQMNAVRYHDSSFSFRQSAPEQRHDRCCFEFHDDYDEHADTCARGVIYDRSFSLLPCVFEVCLSEIGLRFMLHSLNSKRCKYVLSYASNLSQLRYTLCESNTW